MFNFNDLIFKPHTSVGFSTQAVMFFDNGFGVSVITGHNAYGSGDTPYEMAVLSGSPEKYEIRYDTGITEDVLGHLSSDEVSKYMEDVQCL